MSKRCTECKSEFDDTKLFCPNCGAELQKNEAGTPEVKSENVDINNSEYEDIPEGEFKDSESLYNYNLTKRTVLIGVVIAVLIAVAASFISFVDKTDNNSEDSQYYYDETVDNINNTANNNNDSITNENNTAENRLSGQEYIYVVRYGKYFGYPNITFDEAFSHYFGDPEWNYLKAEDGSDVVEFTGRCMYDGTEVTALIQFVVNMDDGSFEWKYLSFNDVSQTQPMLEALIDKAFKSVVMDSDDYKAALSNFVGTWDDKYSERCHMNITQRDDGDFDIEISWGNSAFSTTVWKMTGKFVSPTELTYADCECTDEGENGINEYYYTSGFGTIDIADDGYLYWHDYEEGAGDECFFEKSEYAE